MKNIIFIAPPAAGKGTQSELLVEKYNYDHISTGDLLRAEVATGSEKGKYIGQIQASGEYVDDDIVLELLEKRLEQLDDNRDYVLDGFPRTINQAEKFKEISERLNRQANYVIYLDIDKETALKRTLGRISCPKCNAIYNLYKDTFKEKGRCNKCGAELEIRNDAGEETFIKRFDVYMEKTQPLIDYYRKKGLLHVVKCAEEKEDTFNLIENIINKGN